MDDFNWFLPADDWVGDIPAPELQVDLSNSEIDVDDVALDTVLVRMTTTAVESLCPPVVAQTRPKEGCDPASPQRLRRGRDVLMEDSMVAVDTRRISIAQDPDVVSGIHVMPDCVPARYGVWSRSMMMLRRSCLPEGNLPQEVQKSAEMFPWFRICSRQRYP